MLQLRQTVAKRDQELEACQRQNSDLQFELDELHAQLETVALRLVETDKDNGQLLDENSHVVDAINLLIDEQNEGTGIVEAMAEKIVQL